MAEHLHYREGFLITTERDGGTLLYSVAKKTGCMLAAGFDMGNCDEEEAIRRMLSAVGAHGSREESYRNRVRRKYQ